MKRRGRDERKGKEREGKGREGYRLYKGPMRSERKRCGGSGGRQRQDTSSPARFTSTSKCDASESGTRKAKGSRQGRGPLCRSQVEEVEERRSQKGRWRRPKENEFLKDFLGHLCILATNSVPTPAIRFGDVTSPPSGPGPRECRTPLLQSPMTRSRSPSSSL